MKYPVYSYRDNKVGFMSPFVDQNEDSAIRGFAYAVNNREGIMNFSPADFDLYRIGFFDTDKGVFTETDLPVFVVSGASMVGARND